MSEKNLLLKNEFTNAVYDCMGDAIVATASKHNYGKYDIAKLIMAIYDENFDYVTSYDDYREQVKLLDEYFTNTYDHRLITFEMIKAIKDFQGTVAYDDLINDIVRVESLIRSNTEEKADDLELFTKPLDAEEYDELMTKIEKNKSLRYGFAVIYDRIKRTLNGED